MHKITFQDYRAYEHANMIEAIISITFRDNKILLVIKIIFLVL